MPRENKHTELELLLVYLRCIKIKLAEARRLVLQLLIESDVLETYTRYFLDRPQLIARQCLSEYLLRNFSVLE